ncbi:MULTISPECIES: HlyD family secretion protein [unclassified Paracoccus (in: a-proteobacteria)]|uniref:HlyD family secretion protein n=1 Tax=unclassified Paracoccus (in: a-proteobacteria) TaxID=2688777 RepID=UPI0015FF9326|nr:MULTISPECIES: HlyD family efflux transporter periplasmic adaptor subunit [unclassified Paracoccus (in: a-proteobacteria)]MBB1490156.1 HlyD family efflux transporter periplasmic adaptor subunit [Paracoccus sp. MC1854]MBB1496743.1 HlyD family efflux transporter periplasmic adaptor subunit [Paracoccus sp. MC1862]QQO43746.1 HlyD family efflux transporter periplasmic adaptor subunit [Paracoccus sp. MC1862]
MADFLCALPLLSALLLRCAPPPPLATGHVEGEYIQVAPLVTARVSEVVVRRGDRVAAGQLLAQAETADASAAVDAAEARLKQAESELADLTHGSRPEELAALEAALAAAQATAARAAQDAEREDRLQARGVSSASQSAALRAAADVARAGVAEAGARLEAARLPARADRIEAASGAVAEARAARDTSLWQLDQRSLRAEGAGVVSDIIRNAGEIAGPSAPVLSYLPDGAVTLRVFLPESALSSITVGTRLTVECDGCAPLTARVTWIAEQAEFTPPVIYSREMRQKLVYMVEALPEPADALKPGQIVEVRLAP